MKAILEFNLPKDNIEYLQSVKANDMAIALWQISYNLKKQCIWEAENNNEGLNIEQAYILDGVEIVFNKIYEILDEYNINIEELNK